MKFHFNITSRIVNTIAPPLVLLETLSRLISLVENNKINKEAEWNI